MVEIMTVSEQIIEVVDALCEKFGIAVNWTGENVVPYLEILCGKLITYEICTSIAWMVIMALISIGSIIATKKLYPVFKDGWERNSRSCCDMGWQVASVFAIIGLVITGFTTICVLGTQIMDIIQCSVFPELYIFEYVSALVNVA